MILTKNMIHKLAEALAKRAMWRALCETTKELAEARAVAEMAVQDEVERTYGNDLEWGNGEKIEPDEYARRRLLELRQNIRDTQFRFIGDWNVELIDRDNEQEQSNAIERTGS